MEYLTKKEIEEKLKKGQLNWQVETGVLRDLDDLKLEELPLQEINFRGKTVLAISENNLEKWLIHNTFDIYNAEEYFDDEELDEITYEDIEDSDDDIVTDYSVLYGFVRGLGFKVIDLYEIQHEEIQQWTFDNVFENQRITPEEVNENNLESKLTNCGEIIFLLENINPSTIKLKPNHFLYDYYYL